VQNAHKWRDSKRTTAEYRDFDSMAKAERVSIERWQLRL